MVSVEALSKNYRNFWGRVTVQALRAIDFQIPRGSITALVGNNGSGKTTTIKCLLGLTKASGGQINVLGQQPSDIAVKHRLGFMPEETNLYPFLNARETLGFFGGLFGIKGQDLQKRIDELIDLVGLNHAADRKLKTYSKGMMRRVGLAQALINRPELLILDEPTSGLDPGGIAFVKSLLQKLQAEGVTILVSSHMLFDMDAVCDRLIMLHKGRVVVSGLKSELLSTSGDVFFDTRDWPADLLQQVRTLVTEATGQETGLVRKQNLEAFFLEKTRHLEQDS